MRLVNLQRSPLPLTRRSFTRGAFTWSVPAPTVILRARPSPLRTTKGMPLGIAFVTVRLQVRSDLRLQRGHEHPAGSLAGDLVEQGSPVHPILHRLVADDPQHGWRPLPPAPQGMAVDQAGGYAAGVTGSTIHNFRAYLVLELSTLNPNTISGDTLAAFPYAYRIQ